MVMRLIGGRRFALAGAGVLLATAIGASSLGYGFMGNRHQGNVNQTLEQSARDIAQKGDDRLFQFTIQEHNMGYATDTALQGQIDSVAAQSDQNAGAIDALAGDYEAMTGKVNTVSALASSAKEDAAHNTRNINSINDGLNKNVAELNTRLGGLDTAVGGLAADAVDSAYLKGVQERFGELQEQYTALQSQADANTVLYQALATQFESLSTTLDALAAAGVTAEGFSALQHNVNYAVVQVKALMDEESPQPTATPVVTSTPESQSDIVVYDGCTNQTETAARPASTYFTTHPLAVDVTRKNLEMIGKSTGATAAQMSKLESTLEQAAQDGNKPLVVISPGVMPGCSDFAVYALGRKGGIVGGIMLRFNDGADASALAPKYGMPGQLEPLNR